MASTQPVRKKIYRAKRNFDELGLELQRYFQTNPGKVVIQPESTEDSIIASLEPKEAVPAQISLITGDCLQNLRSSLDYLVWELVLAEGEEPGKHNCFPICPGPTSDAFEEAIKRHGKRPGSLEGIHKDAVTEIRNLQPYRLGDEWEMDLLWVLNELANTNKHRRILLADLRGMDAPSDLRVININGETWVHGSFPPIDKNAKLAPFPTAANPDMHRSLVAFVVFDESGGSKGREVTTVLEGMFEYIYDDIIPRFERFFV